MADAMGYEGATPSGGMKQIKELIQVGCNMAYFLPRLAKLGSERDQLMAKEDVDRWDALVRVFYGEG